MIVVGRHGHAWRLMLFATVVALAGCAGSGSVSLEQARQIVAQFKGQTFTPPPRTITDLTQLLDSTRPDPARIARLRAEGDAVPPTGAGDLALARFYRQRSNAAQDLGRVEQGLADMRTAEKHAGAGGMSYQERRNILRPLAFREVAAGNYQSGLEALKTAGNIQPTTSIATAELSTQLYAAIGDLNAARGFERVASTGRNDRSSTDPFQPWRVQLARVWILHAEGRWQEAEPLLREALVTIDASQKGPVPYSPATREDWIDTTLALAENLLEQGRLVESEVLARQVLTKSLEDRGKDHPTTVRTLSLLARILAAQGRPEDSEALARISLGIVMGFGLPPGTSLLSQAHHGLGRALTAEGKWNEAAAEFDRARGVLASKPDTYEGLYGRDLDIPLALAMIGRAGEGVTRLRAAYEFRKQNLPPGHPELDETLGLLGLAWRRAGETQQALAAFRAAVPGLIKRAEEISGDTPGARERRIRLIVDEYINLLLENGARESTDEAFRLVDSTHGGSVQRALAASSARAAARDPSLADLARRDQDAGQQLKVVEGRLAAYLSALPEEQPPNLIREARAQAAALRVARAALSGEIARQFPDYTSLLAPKAPSISEVRSVLKPGEALVVTWTGATRSAVWAVPAHGEALVRVVPVTANRLVEQVGTLRRALDANIAMLGDVPPFDVQLAHELYATLLAPIEPGWRDAKSLFVMPHGPLAQLPFALLVTAPMILASEQDGRPLFSPYRAVPWLARRAAVSQLPSVASLMTLRGLPPPPQSRRAFIGFGDPWFNPQQAARAAAETGAPILPGSAAVTTQTVPLVQRSAPAFRGKTSAGLALLPRLPETADEVRSIAAALGADPVSDVFLGREANERTLARVDLSNRRVVVFATQGLMPGDLDGLTEPALALTAPEVAGVDGDGLLTMGKILGLRLNADWVVLSACNTAAADGAGAEAVSGLGRAFFYAGTRALLVSNWPVESNSARALTTAVFRLQAEDTTLTRAEALRRAMLSLIEGPGLTDGPRALFSYAHPIFWAPFTLVGDGGGR